MAFDLNTKQRRLLGHLSRQADAVRKTRDWRKGPDLAELFHAVRHARPRARSVRYGGMTFPLAFSLCARIACCPVTGRELVGSVDL
jgi:hypothetical protein